MAQAKKRGRAKKETLKQHVDEIIENVDEKMRAGDIAAGLVGPNDEPVEAEVIEKKEPSKKKNIDPFGIHG